jgi:hypothetical protein
MINFNNSFIECTINNVGSTNKLKINGSVLNHTSYKSMTLIAANTIDRMSNYSGSGLPFPCSGIAFENTPNLFNIDNTGLFDTVFTYPNSYYSQGGKEKIVSSIFFILEDMSGKKEYVRVELPDICPLKSLYNRKNRIGPEFYGAKDYLLPIDTAENVMRSYAKIKSDYSIA